MPYPMLEATPHLALSKGLLSPCSFCTNFDVALLAAQVSVADCTDPLVLYN